MLHPPSRRRRRQQIVPRQLVPGVELLRAPPSMTVQPIGRLDPMMPLSVSYCTCSKKYQGSTYSCVRTCKRSTSKVQYVLRSSLQRRTRLRMCLRARRRRPFSSRHLPSGRLLHEDRRGHLPPCPSPSAPCDRARGWLCMASTPHHPPPSVAAAAVL